MASRADSTRSGAFSSSMRFASSTVLLLDSKLPVLYWSLARPSITLARVRFHLAATCAFCEGDFFFVLVLLSAQPTSNAEPQTRGNDHFNADFHNHFDCMRGLRREG